MKMPEPTEFHRKLEALIGDWAGDETMHPTPWDPDGGPAKGRYEVRGDLGGLGVVQDYVQERGGEVSYVGRGALGYDAAKGCYLWHWSDSMGGVPAEATRGDWSGDRLVFVHAGDMGHQRYTYTFHDDGSLGFSIESSQDGAQWMPFMTGRYERVDRKKKGKAKAKAGAKAKAKTKTKSKDKAKDKDAQRGKRKDEKRAADTERAARHARKKAEKQARKQAKKAEKKTGKRGS